MFQIQLTSEEEILREIYAFRVEVWENSPQAKIVNKDIFPNGWSDDLDIKGNHILVTKEEKLVGAARMNFYEDISSFEYFGNICHLELKYPKEPFCFYSRLVVSKDFRNLGISKMIDEFIIAKSLSNANYILGFSTNRTSYMVNKLQFDIIGKAKLQYHESVVHEVNVITKKLKW